MRDWYCGGDTYIEGCTTPYRTETIHLGWERTVLPYFFKYREEVKRDKAPRQGVELLPETGTRAWHEWDRFVSAMAGAAVGLTFNHLDWRMHSGSCLASWPCIAHDLSWRSMLRVSSHVVGRGRCPN